MKLAALDASCTKGSTDLVPHVDRLRERTESAQRDVSALLAATDATFVVLWPEMDRRSAELEHDLETTRPFLPAPPLPP